MRRISLHLSCRLAAAALLTLGLALTAHGGDESAGLKKRIVALGQTTGDDPMNGEVKALVAHPKQAKKLIAEAVKMAKAKDTTLAYNAAYILAQVAAELKDL